MLCLRDIALLNKFNETFKRGCCYFKGICAENNISLSDSIDQDQTTQKCTVRRHSTFSPKASQVNFTA